MLLLDLTSEATRQLTAAQSETAKAAISFAPRPPCRPLVFRACISSGSFAQAGVCSGGGFREFDDEEDARRKRRAYEERMEKAERKAERKKCDFCKRFACIC
mmetsp:Transcript_55017/g.120005  ORF Transcript_55017/g.120005 Transcript_55017/m.120005 type:complete len:102 (-) Transcript_55017:535-840(-)